MIAHQRGITLTGKQQQAVLKSKLQHQRMRPRRMRPQTKKNKKKQQLLKSPEKEGRLGRSNPWRRSCLKEEDEEKKKEKE